MFTIYALIDPRGFRPFYVGCTCDAGTRRTRHQSPSAWAERDGGSKYSLRMRELHAAGLKPFFGVLEVTEDPSREAFHMDQIRRLGFELVNTGKAAYSPYRKKTTKTRGHVNAQKRQAEDRAVAAAITRMRERRAVSERHSRNP